MYKFMRDKIKQEIRLFLIKNPDSDTSKVKNFIKSGKNAIDFTNVLDITLNKFIKTNINMFNQLVHCIKHKGGIGCKKTAANKTVTLKVKRRLVKKPNSNIRKVAKAVRVSNGIMQTIIKKILTLNLTTSTE